MVEETTQQYFRSLDVDKKLIASIDNGIIILNDALEINYYNKWLEIHTQLKEKDVLGKKIHEIFPNINTKTLRRKVTTSLRMKSPTFYIASTSKYLIPIKINQIKASGLEHMRQDVSVIPFDQEKKLVALIITDQTIMTSTNLLLESNVLKVQELNRALVSEKKIVDQRVLFLKIDTNHILKDVSQAYLNLLKYQKADILEQNIFEYERFNIDSKLKEDILEHSKEKNVFHYEKSALTLEGKDVYLSNTLVPDYDQNGVHNGFIIFSEDITNAKLVQEHQKGLLANSRTAAMGEMISMIAHQWRQPLSVINTLIATLKIKKELDMLSDEIINESYDKIEKTVSYLSQTIDDFRNFFKKNKELQDTTVKELFDKANNLLKTEMDVFNIQYVENVSPDIKITTYQNELVQTLINILKNSIDEFKAKIRPNQKLSVSAEETSTHIIIEIEDNAGGIPAELLPKVFEPYFSTKSKNGTGLGLYVCKTIIQDHLKGKITIRSTGNNTLTLIELPKVLEEDKQTQSE